MKWPAVIAKNLKLLFRSRESAFTIIFGPLLIILLVSAAYTGGSEKGQIVVGVHAPEYTPLVNSVIDTLKAQNYQVNVFANETECTDRIKTGEVHTCILFPADFSVKENGTNTVTFAVDYSRINLVYQIIDGLSKQLDIQSSAISENLAGTMLQRVAVAQQQIHSQRAAAASIDQDLGAAIGQLGQGQSALEGVDVNVSYVDLLQIRGRVNGLAGIVTQVKQQGSDAIDQAVTTLQDARNQAENATRDEIDATILQLQNESEQLAQVADAAPDAASQVSDIIDQAATSMQQVQERFGELVNASQEADAGLGQTKALLTATRGKLATLQGTLQHTDESLQESLGTSAGSVASPITTRIQAVNAEDSKLTFTYPYILMLVIMFLGLMLSSTLIVMDKTSKAAFRNFTTATRDEYHVLLSFVTTFLVLMVQACVILGISYFFVKAPLFANFGVSVVIISIAITLFSFLGMIIGYLAGTQEAAMISSLSIGSVFLFISNLVLPLESMNAIVRTLSAYNPYVVLSELLKQSMLFGLRIQYVPGKIGVLAAAILVLFLLILGVQRSFKARYFRQRSKDLAANAFAQAAKQAKPLLLGEREVRDLFDLQAALDAMTRAEFEAALAQGKEGQNPVALWVRNELKEKSLARKLDTPSKERMILALDTFLRKRTKQLAKES